MSKFGLAQPVRRVEDPRLLKGAGRYTDDIVLPGMLFGIVVRSPYAAATLTSVDATAARNLGPGRQRCSTSTLRRQANARYGASTRLACCAVPCRADERLTCAR